MTAGPIRIAHVLQGLHYGGMERLVNELAQGLSPRGFEIHVVVVEGFGRFAAGLEQVATLHHVPMKSKLSLLYPAGLIRAFRGIRPQIVHSHTGVWLKTGRAARWAGVPFVVHTEHGRPVPDRLSDQLTDRLASRTADVVIAVSEVLAGVLRDGVGVDPSRIRVITNGVDIHQFAPTDRPEAARRRLGIPNGAQVIGSVGRLEGVKDYQLALTAFAQLETRLANGSTPVLVLVGDGRERPALERMAHELGIASRVHFLGWQDEVEQVYAAFDLFTLTSRSEGTSVSLLEAMSAGLCPVVTDVGGNRAVLGPDLAESLVPSGDARGLTAAWTRYLSDGELRRATGYRARERVRQAFSLEQMVDRHVALYHGLAARGDLAGAMAEEGCAESPSA